MTFTEVGYKFFNETDDIKSFTDKPTLHTIGFLGTNINDAIKNLIKNHKIVQYNNVEIPATKDSDSFDTGLYLKKFEGIPLIHKLDDFNSSIYFLKTVRDKPLENLDELKDATMKRLETSRMFHGIDIKEATDYSEFFKAIGYNISVDNIKGIFNKYQEELKPNASLKINPHKDPTIYKDIPVPLDGPQY